MDRPPARMQMYLSRGWETVNLFGVALGIIQHFCKITESTLGRWVNPVVHLALATVATGLYMKQVAIANQHFYNTLLSRGRGM